MQTPINLWTSTGHAGDYLERADSIPHRREGESTLLELIPAGTRRILDLGTGDGRPLALVKVHLANILGPVQVDAVALDFSSAMLEAARERFNADSSVTIVADDLDQPLPELASSTRWSRASPFIIWFTSASVRCMRKSSRC